MPSCKSSAKNRVNWDNAARQNGLEFLANTNSGKALYRCQKCNEEFERYRVAVSRGRVSCPGCEVLRWQNSADAFGLRFLEKVGRGKAKYSCLKCGEIAERKRESIRNFRCDGCRTKRREEDASNAGLEFLGMMQGGRKARYICKSCGAELVKQLGSVFRRDFRCDTCDPKASLGEQRVRQHLEASQIDFQSEFSVKIEGALRRFDFKLEDMVIEFDGAQHFSEVKEVWGSSSRFNDVTAPSDRAKEQYCRTNGIQMVRIHYSCLKNDMIPAAVNFALRNRIDPNDPIYLIANAGTIQATSVSDYWSLRV